MNLKTLAARWLRDHGYDGLFVRDQCACMVDDLMPCENPSEFCEAGRKSPCKSDDLDGANCYGDCKFHIGRDGQP